MAKMPWPGPMPDPFGPKFPDKSFNYPAGDRWRIECDDPRVLRVGGIYAYVNAKFPHPPHEHLYLHHLQLQHRRRPAVSKAQCVEAQCVEATGHESSHESMSDETEDEEEEEPLFYQANEQTPEAKAKLKLRLQYLKWSAVRDRQQQVEQRVLKTQPYRIVRPQCRVIYRCRRKTDGRDACWCVDLLTGERVVLETERLLFVRRFEDATPDEQAGWVAQFGYVYMQYEQGALYDYSTARDQQDGLTVVHKPGTRRVVPLSRNYDCGGQARINVLVMDECVYYVDTVPARLLLREPGNPERIDVQPLLARVKTPFHRMLDLADDVRNRYADGSHK